MAAPNLASPTTISGKTAVLAVGTSYATVIANSAASGKLIRVTGVWAANVDGTNSADITLSFQRSSTDWEIAPAIPVAAQKALVPVARDIALNLEEGDTLRAKASAASDITIVCSYEEIS